MRIDALQLIAFGPFTETVLDLSSGKEGFHLIYGANEAGKSSALRALRDLFYGIPARSPDNFIHPYPKMRIGARLKKRNGDTLQLMRRKGLSNTLRGPDDEIVLADSLLQHYLNGIDADLFSTMFGIGYEDLVRGGKDIIHGGGDVGRLLFSASSGIANLLEIQNELQSEVDQLFKPSGKKQKINEALARLNQIRKSFKNAQLNREDWSTHDHTLRKAIEHKKKIQDELTTHQRKLNWLNRVKQAYPHIAERRELENDLKAYASAVLLPEEFPDQRRKLISEQAIVENQKSQSMRNIDSINQAISALSMSSLLLDNGEAVEEIHLLLGRERQATNDRVKLSTRRSGLLTEAKEILKSQGKALSIEEAEKLRITKIEAMHIQDLGARYERIVTRIESARENLPELSEKMNAIDGELKALPAQRSVEDLENALADTEAYGPLEKNGRDEQTAIRFELDAIGIEQGKLGLADRSFNTLESLDAPQAETIRIYEERFNAVNRRLEDIRDASRKSQVALLDVKRQIKTLGLEQAVPTEEDLIKARELRDMGWTLIAEKLNGQAQSEESLFAYLAHSPRGTTLGEAFEADLNQSDDVADRLRREAGRVLKKAMLLAEEITHAEQLQQLQKDHEITESERRQLSEAWSKLWQSTGIKPRSPKEMTQWFIDFKSLSNKIRDIRRRRAACEELLQTIDVHRRKLSGCIGALGSACIDPACSLTTLMKKARSIIADEEMLQRKREQLLRDKSKLARDLKTVQSRLASSQEDLSQWRVLWKEALRPMGLHADARPNEANVVMDDLKSLFEKIKEADILQKRIEGMDRDTEAFAGKVAILVDVVAKDLSKRPAPEAAIALHHRLKATRDASTKKETLEKQLAHEREQLKRAIQKESELEMKLQVMCKEAGCDHIDGLPEAEQRSTRRRDIESRLELTEAHLRRLSGGEVVDDFIRQALQVDPDGMIGDIERIEEVIEGLNGEKSDLDQTIGSEKTELRKMDGSAQAAELAGEIQIVLGGIENDAEHYVRLKIATKVLSMAIERYREKSQGPILSRASLLFNQITGGAFKGIRTEYDLKGHHRIVGIRQNDGEIVHVEGMSDGTADQLYLALRLAGLEMYLDNNEPIPFIVDDILIKFDDGRSAATLQALGKLAEKTQLIFFTHHRHLKELADAAMDPSILFHHTL